MKIIQINAWNWRLYWPVKNFFGRERPDIIQAQESIDGDKYVPSDHYTADGIIKEGFATHVARGASVPFGSLVGTEWVTNVATFANQPVERQAIIPILDPGDDSGNLDPAYHSMMHAVTAVKGRKLNLLNLHGRLTIDRSLPHDGKMGTPATERHFKKVAAYVAGLSGPTILSGDFNLLPNADVFGPLNEHLRDLVEPSHMKGGRNANAWREDEIVSHMFVSPEIKVESFEVARDVVSDHQPLVMKFHL